MEQTKDALELALQMSAEQGSELWEDARVGRFTASEIYKLMTEPRSAASKQAGLLSEGAMTYIEIKVAETLTKTMKENSYAYPLVYGKEMEPLAINHFMATKKEWVYEPATFVPFGDHAGGSPDGYIISAVTAKKEGIEVKCPFSSENHITHLLIKDQEMLKSEKPEYYWQIMSNLLFTHLDIWHFISYDPRFPDKQKMHHITVRPDESDFNLITKKLEKAIEEKLKLINLLL